MPRPAERRSKPAEAGRRTRRSQGARPERMGLRAAVLRDHPLRLVVPRRTRVRSSRPPAPPAGRPCACAAPTAPTRTPGRALARARARRARRCRGRSHRHRPSSATRLRCRTGRTPPRSTTPSPRPTARDRAARNRGGSTAVRRSRDRGATSARTPAARTPSGRRGGRRTRPIAPRLDREVAAAARPAGRDRRDHDDHLRPPPRQHQRRPAPHIEAAASRRAWRGGTS